jgi:hypothetical protein
MTTPSTVHWSTVAQNVELDVFFLFASCNHGYRNLGHEITHSLALRTHVRRLGGTLEALYTKGRCNFG